MDVARTLREARLAAHLSQRQLAARAGVPQSTVARIESGRMMPRVDTLDRLLRGLGSRLGAECWEDRGVDIWLIRENLKLTPRQRVKLAVEEAHAVSRFERRP